MGECFLYFRSGVCDFYLFIFSGLQAWNVVWCKSREYRLSKVSYCTNLFNGQENGPDPSFVFILVLVFPPLLFHFISLLFLFLFVYNALKLKFLLWKAINIMCSSTLDIVWDRDHRFHFDHVVLSSCGQSVTLIAVYQPWSPSVRCNLCSGGLQGYGFLCLFRPWTQFRLDGGIVCGSTPKLKLSCSLNSGR